MRSVGKRMIERKIGKVYKLSQIYCALEMNLFHFKNFSFSLAFVFMLIVQCLLLVLLSFILTCKFWKRKRQSLTCFLHFFRLIWLSNKENISFICLSEVKFLWIISYLDVDWFEQSTISQTQLENCKLRFFIIQVFTFF